MRIQLYPINSILLIFQLVYKLCYLIKVFSELNLYQFCPLHPKEVSLNEILIGNVVI